MNDASLPTGISSFGRVGPNEWIAIWDMAHPPPSDQAAERVSCELNSRLSWMPGAKVRLVLAMAASPSSNPLVEDDDYSAALRHGVMEDELREDVARWAHGECGLLAVRMHEWSGWPILSLGWDHFCVQRPDGALVDAYGVTKPEHDRDYSHLEKVAARYEATDVKWADENAECLALGCDDEQRAEADVFLDSGWMRVVFPSQHRLAEAIAYLPLELRDDEDDAVDDVE